ncbi:MAG TPA: allantoinase AllB [Polyangia bacterium]|nr:allantoinase AllB [Polyangia bacterium]
MARTVGARAHLAKLTAHPGLWGLRSRRIVGPDGRVRPGTVLIEQGRIRALVSRPASATVPPDVPVEDLGTRVISPGLVDCHVHINEPGHTDWEGFTTATRAAAAGGVTALVDMPLNCLPVTTRRAALEEKLRAAAGQLHVDVGFWGGVIPGNAGELAELAAGGALGCKAFLVHSGIDEFPNVTEADLRVAMPVLRDAGLPLLAHAELDLGAAEDEESDPRKYSRYLHSRPAAWEDAAIALLIRLSRETGCAVHVVHLSSAASLPQIARAKDEGLRFTVETCPHYLCLQEESIPDGATEYKCAPPIRDHENREALWQGLKDGVIDFVVTDHSPCTPALKDRERGDFARAWGGIASLQLGLPAVWTEARGRGLGLGEIASWMSARPAALAGLGLRKGQIAPGFDADLVVWDPDAEISVEAEQLHFRHKISPYLGRRLMGRVEATFLRGQLVYDGSGHPAGPVGVPILGRDTRA